MIYKLINEDNTLVNEYPAPQIYKTLSDEEKNNIYSFKKEIEKIEWMDNKESLDFRRFTKLFIQLIKVKLPCYAKLSVKTRRDIFWENIEKGVEKDGLVSALMEEYGIDSTTAEADVSEFLEMLGSFEII